jgi:hypothetical protein
VATELGRLPGRVGQDECWWSRLALPTLSSWTEEGKPLRLLQKSVAKDGPSGATKAISCYGLYLPELDQTWLRFVDGRPVSSITTQFLRWCCEMLQAVGKKILLLIWDRAQAGTSPGISGGGSENITARSKRAGME